MRHTLVALFAFLPASILSGGAVYLAANGTSAWVWFLIAACFAGGSYSFSQKDEG